MSENQRRAVKIQISFKKFSWLLNRNNVDQKTMEYYFQIVQRRKKQHRILHPIEITFKSKNIIFSWIKAERISCHKTSGIRNVKSSLKAKKK